MDFNCKILLLSVEEYLQKNQWIIKNLLKNSHRNKL